MADLRPETEIENGKAGTLGGQKEGAVQITLGNTEVLTVKLLAEVRDLLVKTNQLLAAIAVKTGAAEKDNG